MATDIQDFLPLSPLTLGQFSPGVVVSEEWISYPERVMFGHSVGVLTPNRSEASAALGLCDVT